MTKRYHSNSYNDYLFNGSFLRRYFHLSRFYWLQKTIIRNKIKYKNILELGCGDGKTLDFIPKNVFNYCGLDANWNNSLDSAKKKYEGMKNIKFDEVKNIKDITLDSDEFFDLIISMETLEHIHPKHVCNYLQKLSQHSKGYFLITVPNEKGIFFLLKRLAKFKSDSYQYTFTELINIVLGKTNKVNRSQHKGFDYDHMIYDIKKFFRIEKVEGAPFGKFLPLFLCFNICIIARSYE